MYPKNRFFLAALALAMGCAEADFEFPRDTLESGAAPSSEVHYLRDREAIAARSGPSGIRFVPTQSFRALEVMFSVEGEPTLQVRGRYAETRWGQWTDVDIDFFDDGFGRAALVFSESTMAVELKGDTEDISFARLEFFSSLAPEAAHVGHHDDPVHGESHFDLSEPLSAKAAHQGRWAQPPETLAIGQTQHVPYTTAPAWNGGRNCGGRLLPGARTLGRYLVDQFPGARYYQGYNCRRIGGSQSMSLHGTGRAIDVFIPLDRGQADNDLGDPVANWLVENAERIGIQLIIWDRTLWSGQRNPHARHYGGPHPHHDHLHIELTPEAAAENTPFFGGVSPPPADRPPAPVGPSGCSSATLGRDVDHGVCVQMAYPRCGGRCNWAQCTDGSWLCVDLADCGLRHTNRACAAPAVPPVSPPSPAPPAAEPVPEPAPQPAPEPAPLAAACDSYTLGRPVPAGESVQMHYESCGGVCEWARCDDGAWNCVDAPSAVNHPNPRCSGAARDGAQCYSRTLGRSVDHGDRVQMAYASCADRQRCNWAVCNDGDWDCTQDPSDGLDFGHAACR